MFVLTMAWTMACTQAALVRFELPPFRFQQRMRQVMALESSAVDESVFEENRQSHRASIEHSMKFGGRDTLASAPLSGTEHTWKAYSFVIGKDASEAEQRHGRDAVPHAPFGMDDLARISRVPLFTTHECAAIIDEAEADARWREAGRIAFYARKAGSTRQLEELPRACAWLGERFNQVLVPAIRAAYPLAMRDSELRVADARVVKYNASAGQIMLGVHRDGPTLTATIALNSMACYEGGGTMIEALADRLPDGSSVLKCDVGHVLLHPGILRHAGAPITRGLRYILVCFLFDAQHVEHDRLCVLRGNSFLKRALQTKSAPPTSRPEAARPPADVAAGDGLAPAWGDAFARRTAASTARPQPMSDYRRSLLMAAAASYGDAIVLGAAQRAEWAHVGLGQTLLELGELEDAISALQSAILLSPTNAHALSTLSIAHQQAGRLEEAYVTATAAARADPSSAAAHSNRGLLLAALGRNEEALVAFVEGLRVDAEDTELLVNTGVQATELGHTSTALACFSKALKGDPDHAVARHNLELLQAQ